MSAPSSRSVIVIGTGAVGGFFGARLVRSGYDVHFLVRSDYEHIGRHGLRIDSVDGDFTLPRVQVHASAGTTVPPCDIALVTLKTTENRGLGHLLPRVLVPGGTVVLLQNGLGEEERVAAIPGVGSVVAGLAFVCVTKVGPGHIHHLDYGTVRLAEYAPGGVAAGLTPALQALCEFFEGAGIPVIPEPSWLRARWHKLVWNIPYNGLSVVLRADTAALMASSPIRALIESLMREVSAASAAEGHPIREESVGEMLANTAVMRPYLPSMRGDFDAGRELELETMYAVPIRRARAAGAPMRQVEALHAELQFLSARRAATA